MSFSSQMKKAKQQDTRRITIGAGLGAVIFAVGATLALMPGIDAPLTPATVALVLIGFVLVFGFALTSNMKLYAALKAFYNAHGVEFLGFFDLTKIRPEQEVLRTSYTLEDGRSGIITVFIDKASEPQIAFAPSGEQKLVAHG